MAYDRERIVFYGLRVRTRRAATNELTLYLCDGSLDRNIEMKKERSLMI